jgi:hypothetical protein
MLNVEVRRDGTEGNFGGPCAVVLAEVPHTLEVERSRGVWLWRYTRRTPAGHQLGLSKHPHAVLSMPEPTVECAIYVHNLDIYWQFLCSCHYRNSNEGEFLTF